ncbi:hypothetical protein L873DRAFT_1812770 [Choiromyces venosus 120613-1]|uniref:Uncharacterized protein n=1 Tax=Choiromyces venosus 120613-1 TaxID=1336337 RepID=A0A3N4JGD3_9PEZI|nr:hypothetical protein L873DRAFT_1812770 [Choiromyces venosus 120613-1]
MAFLFGQQTHSISIKLNLFSVYSKISWLNTKDQEGKDNQRLKDIRISSGKNRW